MPYGSEQVQRMIGDYRNYVTRQEELAYRKDRDRKGDEKWAMGEFRARETHGWKQEDRAREKLQRDQQADYMLRLRMQNQANQSLSALVLEGKKALTQPEVIQA